MEIFDLAVDRLTITILILNKLLPMLDKWKIFFKINDALSDCVRCNQTGCFNIKIEEEEKTINFNICM